MTLSARSPYVAGRASLGVVVGPNIANGSPSSQGHAGMNGQDNFIWFDGNGWDSFSGLYVEVKQTPRRIYSVACGVAPGASAPFPTVDVVVYGETTTTRTVANISTSRVLEATFWSGEATDHRKVHFRVRSGADVRFTECQVTGYEPPPRR